jgi:hypothetical protein
MDFREKGKYDESGHVYKAGISLEASTARRNKMKSDKKSRPRFNRA